MNIVNIIHIGDEVKNWDDMNPEEQREVGTKLNTQALTAIGYRPVEAEDTA